MSGKLSLAEAFHEACETRRTCKIKRTPKAKPGFKLDTKPGFKLDTKPSPKKYSERVPEIVPEYGHAILNGRDDPISSVGRDGDFYINTSDYFLFGPKNDGLWGIGYSLVGPKGHETLQDVYLAGSSIDISRDGLSLSGVPNSDGSGYYLTLGKDGKVRKLPI